MKTVILVTGLIILLASLMPLTLRAPEELPVEQAQLSKESFNTRKVKRVTLQESIAIALNNNQTRTTSRFAIEISDSQLRQARLCDR